MYNIKKNQIQIYYYIWIQNGKYLQMSINTNTSDSVVFEVSPGFWENVKISSFLYQNCNQNVKY